MSALTEEGISVFPDIIEKAGGAPNVWFQDNISG